MKDGSKNIGKTIIPFKNRTRKITSGFFMGGDIKEVQCPICQEWFAYYSDYDLRGVKLHIRKWAGKEATAYALGEIKKV